MSWYKVLLILAVATCISTPAFATVVFSDDFEAGASGDVFGAAVVGSWTLSGSGTGAVPTNSLRLAWPTAGGGLPASIYGAMYGGMIRGMPEVAAGAYNYADATFANQTNPANRVRLEAEIYGQDGNGSSHLPCDLKLAFMAGATETSNVSISGGSTSGVVSVNGVATGLTWDLGVWHHVTMDYYPTTATFSLAVDAQTPATGLAMISPSAIDGVRFSQTSAGKDRWSVVDNVVITGAIPEPSGLVLLATALMGLIAYAWKGRR
jgi:hypothetical protein